MTAELSLREFMGLIGAAIGTVAFADLDKLQKAVDICNE